MKLILFLPFFFFGCASDFEATETVREASPQEINRSQQAYKQELILNCRAGQAGECRRLAEVHSNESEFTESYLSLGRACWLKDNTACQQLEALGAQIKLQSLINKKISSCVDKRVAQSCLEIADLNYRDGNLDSAIDFAGRACIHKSDFGCRFQQNLILIRNNQQQSEIAEKQLQAQERIASAQMAAAYENARQLRQAVQAGYQYNFSNYLNLKSTTYQNCELRPTYSGAYESRCWQSSY
jgi:hypothetical protein